MQPLRKNHTNPGSSLALMVIPTVITKVIAVLMITFTVDANSAVYRCVGPEDRVHYEQFGCPAHTLQEPVELAEFNIITSTQLNDLERAQLARLESRLAAAQRSNLQKRDRRSSAAQQDRRESERLCSQAQSNLEQLAAQRRGGYAASEDRALSLKETRWESAEKENC